MGFVYPSKQSQISVAAYSVHGSRLAVSTAARSSKGLLSCSATEVTMREAAMGFDGPPRHTSKVPSESCAAPTTFMGFSRPYSDISVKIHEPGLPHPVWSVFRVFRPLDGLLPSRLPTSRIGATHGVHPAELFPSAEPYASRRRCPLAVSGIAYSCSENQKFTMPRDFRALLTAEIRTRRQPKPAPGPILSWAFCRLSRAFPSCRRTSFLVPSLMRFAHPIYGRSDDRRFRASTNTWVGRPSQDDQLS